MPTPTADVRWDAEPAEPRAVVLVLHGGQEHSTRANSWARVPVWWMIPFARTVRRAGDGAFAVARVRYAVRGWNDEAADPVHDTARVLDEVAARFPGVPVALVGHSMGGRVALRLVGDERVTTVVGLAPWVDPGDVAQQAYRPHRGVGVLLLHGLADRITNPTGSRGLVERFVARGTDARWVGLTGDKHAMIRRRPTWDRLVAAFLRRELLDAQPARPLSAAEDAALVAGSVSVL